MKYMEELNKFNVWIALHPDVSSSAKLLWFVLMHYNNMFGWKRVFSVSISTLASATGLSVSSVKRARSVLQRTGRIRYTSRNRSLATLYEIISLADEGIRTAYVGNTEPSNEEMNPNHITTSVESKEDRATVQSDDVQDVVRDESRDEQYSERCSKSQGERIYRQDKTRQDISKETTIKKGEAAKGKMKEGPKRCYTSPSVAVVCACGKERDNRIDSERLVGICKSKRTTHVVDMRGPLLVVYLCYADVLYGIVASYTDWLCRLSTHPRYIKTAMPIIITVRLVTCADFNPKVRDT